MRLVSFVGPQGPGYGLLTAGGIVDLASRLAVPDLRSLLGDGARAAEAWLGAAPDFDLACVVLLSPLPNPRKILCVGINYDEHRAETGRAKSDYPTIFTRFADTLVGHNQPLIRPRVSNAFDFEGELAVIVGKGGRHIQAARALDHVAGYSCFNDASVRDWQSHTSQFTPGKNFPGTGAFGPALVTQDEVGDPQGLRLTTRLNARVMQDATSDQMIFPVREIIAYISAFTTLLPGDVICTGTPGGVGFMRQPPVFMKGGDRVEVEISKIGVLANPVLDEKLADG
jgi:2-keto-4-pentenoate hydratase/2-oxohepta-3-ene-1,7-dioic acid hydratase in catechol pathway